MEEKAAEVKLGQENRTIKTVWSPHCGHVAHVELKEDKKPDSVKGLMEEENQAKALGESRYHIQYHIIKIFRQSGMKWSGVKI